MKNRRILLESCAAHVPLLTAASALGLGSKLYIDFSSVMLPAPSLYSSVTIFQVNLRSVYLELSAFDVHLFDPD